MWSVSNFAFWYYSLSFTCSYHFQWTWPYFKVTSLSMTFIWTKYIVIWLSWNFIRLLNALSRSWIYINFFWQAHIFQGDNWRISSFRTHIHTKALTMAFSRTPWKESLSSFVLLYPCLRSIIIVILDLMTLTLVQGHMCVRNRNCKWSVLDSCPVQFNRCTVATYMKKITFIIIWVILVCTEGRSLSLLFSLLFFCLWRALACWKL